MKVFKVDVDVDKFQWLMPVDDFELVYPLIDFDGSKKKQHWQPIKFYVFNPKQEKGNFYSLGASGAFACDQQALDILVSFLGFGSEILPIILEDGTPLYIINVTDCVNALDYSNTKYDIYDDGTKGRILQHAFHKNRFTESSIFKIPETCKVDVLTYCDVKNSEEEFYYAYQKTQLKGLEFDLLYQG